MLRSNAWNTRADEYKRFRVAESEARLELTVARAELIKHKQEHP